MGKLHFRNWLLNEVADFGFDRSRPAFDRNAGEKPIYPFRLEYIRKVLRSHKVGNKEAHEGFMNHVHWGSGFGAIRVNFTPFGGLRASIRRESVDAQGQAIWLCKKVIFVNDYYLKYPDALAMDILKDVELIDKEAIEVGVSNYRNLESLTRRLATYLDRKMIQRILMYEGIREVRADREYIIHWGCTGMGRQRQDQKRLDQFQIVVRYDEETGLIQVVGQEVGSPIQSYNWSADPSEFIEYFSPTQESVEICDSILTHLNVY